jgi:hypothetical protein
MLADVLERRLVLVERIFSGSPTFRRRVQNRQ